MVMADFTALKSTNDDLGMGYSYGCIVKDLSADQGMNRVPKPSYRQRADELDGKVCRSGQCRDMPTSSTRPWQGVAPLRQPRQRRVCLRRRKRDLCPSQGRGGTRRSWCRW